MAAREYEFYLRVMKVSVYFIDIDEMSRFKTTCFTHFQNDEKVVTNRYYTHVV